MSLKDIIEQSGGRIELIDATPRTRKGEKGPLYMKAQCPECDRIFDLLDETDAAEWAYGHDCEV